MADTSSECSRRTLMYSATGNPAKQPKSEHESNEGLHSSLLSHSITVPPDQEAINALVADAQQNLTAAQMYEAAANLTDSESTQVLVTNKWMGSNGNVLLDPGAKGLRQEVFTRRANSRGSSELSLESSQQYVALSGAAKKFS